MNHKILECRCGVSDTLILMKYIFHDFFPSCVLCHSHTITHCRAGRGDSVDGVVTCYRMDSRIFTPGGGSVYLFLLVCTSTGAHTAMFFSGKSPTLLEAQQSGHVADYPSHSRADIKNQRLLLLYANFVMLWSDLYLLHMCG